SNFHSLQTRLSRRFSSRLTANVNYTWSKAISEVDADDNGAGNRYFLDRRRDRGPATFDRTHVLNIDYVYNLPDLGSRWLNNGVGRALLDGWEISGITRVQSGLPLTVTSNGNPGTLGGAVRADYLGGALYPADKTRFEWFNPLVFARPKDGTLGNTGRG